jgi:hypothetical protein
MQHRFKVWESIKDQFVNKKLDTVTKRSRRLITTVVASRFEQNNRGISFYVDEGWLKKSPRLVAYFPTDYIVEEIL